MVRICLMSVSARYGVSYLVKENYLYFHISSWKKSGKSAEVFGRCHAPPPFLPLAVPRSPSPPVFVVIASLMCRHGADCGAQGGGAGAARHAGPLRPEEKNGAEKQRAGAGFTRALVNTLGLLHIYSRHKLHFHFAACSCLSRSKPLPAACCAPATPCQCAPLQFLAPHCAPP